jgi:hypothetical protein
MFVSTRTRCLIAIELCIRERTNLTVQSILSHYVYPSAIQVFRFMVRQYIQAMVAVHIGAGSSSAPGSGSGLRSGSGSGSGPRSGSGSGSGISLCLGLHMGKIERKKLPSR